MKQICRLFKLTLYEAINQYGETPPPEIINRYPDSPKNCPKKVVNIRYLRPIVYPLLNMDKRSKPITLNRSIDSLIDSGKCMFFNYYLWTIE